MAPKKSPTPALPERRATHPFFGHVALRAALARTLARDALPATLLIYGQEGAGKQSLAHWIAQTRLCAAEQGKPCGSCPSCRKTRHLEHPDIHWHFPLPRPKQSGSRDRLAQALETMRIEMLAEWRAQPLRPPASAGVRGIYRAAAETIRDRAHSLPSVSDEQFFIIGDAEYLVPQEASQAAANTLLKLLEEPTTKTRFILTSSRPESLLDTIRSRALQIHLPPLPVDEVRAFLERECDASPDAAATAAALSQGSIGVALGHLDPEGVPAVERNQAQVLLQAALGERPSDIYASALTWGTTGGRGMQNVLALLQSWIRDLGAASLGRSERVVNVDKMAFLEATARRLPLTPDRVAHAIDQVERARTRALGNVSPQVLVASLLLDLRRALTRMPT